MTHFYSIQCKHLYQLKSLLLAQKFKCYNDSLSWYAHDGSVICSLLVVAISSGHFAAIKDQISKSGEVYMPLTDIPHEKVRTLFYRRVMTLKVLKGSHFIPTESVETKIADVYDADNFQMCFS
ncbi:hypothetical protein GGF37_000317 [Kickxella alabastrina]|nr:hypothetical protein GGF37_000317 [Kickxella alabastrina]